MLLVLHPEHPPTEKKSNTKEMGARKGRLINSASHFLAYRSCVRTSD